MINLTVTEKEWDKVRPGSVKHTGLSQAIRTFNKLLPKKAPDDPKTYDGVLQSMRDLSKAIKSAEVDVKKAKDDKKGAAGKLTAWSQDVDKGLQTLTNQRTQLGILKAAKEADEKMKDLAKQVDDAILMADQMEKDLKAGKVKDFKKALQDLQKVQTAYRDGVKATQKDGFMKYIATISQVLAWGVKPKDVPLPPNGKATKDKLPNLEKKAEATRIALENAMNSSGSTRTGAAADAAKDILKEYAQLKTKLKGWIPLAKKFATDAKNAGDQFKGLIKKGATHDKLLPILDKIHKGLIQADETSMKECARGRKSSGDIQAKRIKIRDDLKSKDVKAFQEFETLVSEEWNLCMAIYREISEPIGVGHRQVERVLRLVGEMSPAAAQAADAAKKKYDTAIAGLKSKYT